MLLTKNQRGLNDHVSVVKALAIILLLYGHTNVPALSHTLSMLRMPVFALASGYCFKDYYLEHRMEFARRRVRSLYWPFVKWSLVFLLLHNALLHLGFYHHGEVSYTWRSMASALPHIAVLHTPDELLGGYWFVTELFFTTIIFAVLSPLVRRAPLAWCAAFVAVAMVLAVTGWHLRVRAATFLLTAFYTFGYWVRGRELPHGWAVIGVLAATVWAASLAVPGHVNDIHPATTPIFFLVVLLGCWVFAAVAWHIVKGWPRLSRLLCYIGNRTLIILTLHITAMRLLSWVLAQWGLRDASQVANFPPTRLFPLYMLAGLALPLLYDALASRVKQRIALLVNSSHNKL